MEVVDDKVESIVGKGEDAAYQHFLLFLQCFQKLFLTGSLTLSQTTLFLDWFKLKELVDDNFKFDENGGNFLKQIENTVGKEEIARFEQFLLFPQFFQKICIPDT